MMFGYYFHYVSCVSLAFCFLAKSPSFFPPVKLCYYVVSSSRATLTGSLSSCYCFSLFFLYSFVSLSNSLCNFNRPSPLYRRLSIRYTIVIIIYITYTAELLSHFHYKSRKQKKSDVKRLHNFLQIRFQSMTVV